MIMSTPEAAYITRLNRYLVEFQRKRDQAINNIERLAHHNNRRVRAGLRPINHPPELIAAARVAPDIGALR